MNEGRQHYQIEKGDILSLLRNNEIPEVHCVVTSPPYYCLRQYGKSTAEIGGEQSPEDYARRLVEVFNLIPLHAQGSVWVNMGDKRSPSGSLLEVPSLFARLMIQSGWLLADRVIWAKAVVKSDGKTLGEHMPEPVTGRLNGNGHETIYRFVKARRVSDAWTDTCAVCIPRENVPDVRYLPEVLMTTHTSIQGRNLTNVWQVALGKTSKSHYAVYPVELCERPIAMTCPFLVNPDGTFVRREIKKEVYDDGRGFRKIGKYTDDASPRWKTGRQDTARRYIPKKPVTVGWTDIQEEAMPGIVLDPFVGSGTTGVAALKLGRSFFGVDLYDEYLEIAKERCGEALRVANHQRPLDLILAAGEKAA
jgi:site-specific DNA-methyltransferase (adenine-specific)